jgi:hypothetical protein
MQQMFFIADLIACSTCFGHHYAHHQELESIIQVFVDSKPTRCTKFLKYIYLSITLYMFRAPLCPSSGAREYYTVGYRLWSLGLGFQVVSMVFSKAAARKPDTQLYNTLELLMMGIMVPETC